MVNEQRAPREGGGPLRLRLARYTPGMSLQGLRVLALESRRSTEMAELIRKQGGEPFVAPSMREVPLGESDAIFRFADRLASGDFDMMMLLTGVGTRQLSRVLGERFAEGLSRVTIAARGPKPVAALREMGIAPAVVAPEPNTWRELLAVTEGRPERRIALQEYGRSNPELIESLRARGAEVTPVRVYQYGLPEDVQPLREAARRLAGGEFDVALFTTATQIEHLAQVAREQGLENAAWEALRKCRIGSIGPTTTEALEEFGIHPDFEPSHPKMGLLVREAPGGARE
jgi:uroporphyrinogen-III synthase